MVSASTEARWMMAALAALSLACSGGDKGGVVGDSGTTGGGDGGGGGGGPLTVDDFINTTATPTGDFTGFEGGLEASGAWLVQTPAPEKVTDLPMSGKVEDFETEDGVPEATVELYFADAIGGVPDATFTSDSSGLFTGQTGRSCTPLAYKTATDPALGDTKNTFELHQVSEFGTSIDESFNSVSSATYALIPSLLGISIDPEKGTAAGTVYDVNGDPVQGAQVIVRDADDKIPASLVVKYFVEDFPNRDQPETSEDGLWVAINIPPGDWRVDAYVFDGSGYIQVATSGITVFGDSINVANLWTGYDSVHYPDSCLP